jgi:hypothetical protein
VKPLKIQYNDTGETSKMGVMPVIQGQTPKKEEEANENGT